MRGGRFTNETAVGAPLSQQVANAATPEHSCNWITSFPLRGAVATRFRISGCFAERTTAFMLDNALGHCTWRRRWPSSECAHRSLKAPLTRSVATHAPEGSSPSWGAGRSLPIDDEDLIV